MSPIRSLPSIHSMAVLLALTSVSVAQEASELSAPTEALIFKSGQSYVYREVDLEPGVRSTRVRLPDALHGTVWLESSDVELSRAIAREAKVLETEPITNLAGIVRRAIGHNVTMSVQTGTETRIVTGQVVRTINGARQTNRYGGVSPVPQPFLVVVQSGSTLSTYPLSSVVGVTTRDPELATADWTYQRESAVPVLDVEHAAVAPGATGRVGLAAMTGGLAWSPSYVLELDGDGPARLVGKAVIVNDSERLVDTRVRLVVGYPNLQFASVRSSLLPDVTVKSFREALGAQRPGGSGQSGAMSQIVSNTAMRNLGRQANAVGSLAAVAGEAAEDLYLYDVGRVSLEKGERAYLPLIEASVPIAHRFDWDLDDLVQNARFVSRSDEEPETIWHVLLLDNNTDAPWTTAPILIQGERGPLAQSLLNYTPAGSTDARVKMTKALNLVAESVEFRVGGSTAPRNESTLFGHRYESIEVQGRLELTNHSQKASPVRIRKTFSGDLISADGAPKVVGGVKRLGSVNVSRTAEWTFELEAGATWTAEYRYEVLIRR